MIQEELSGEIIGAGMDVLNELRPGLDEKLYERAMIIELKRRGHTLSIQRAFPVFYPCNPWFVRDFEQIVASLAPKEPPK